MINKNLRCRKETARCFLSLNISLSYSRSSEMVPFESLGMVSYSPSIVTMALSCIVSEMKRDIDRKSRFFHSPLHSMPPLYEGSPAEYCHTVWCGETSYPKVKKV